MDILNESNLILVLLNDYIAICSFPLRFYYELYQECYWVLYFEIMLEIYSVYFFLKLCAHLLVHKKHGELIYGPKGGHIISNNVGNL